MSPRDTIEYAETLCKRIATETDVVRLRAIASELAETCAAVARTDHTPDYEYSGGKAKHLLDALGERPKPGRRWMTPRELIGTTLFRMVRP